MLLRDKCTMHSGRCYRAIGRAMMVAKQILFGHWWLIACSAKKSYHYGRIRDDWN